MKKKPDPKQAQRDAQRREIIEKRKQENPAQAPEPTETVEKKGSKSEKKKSLRDQRREIIENRKQSPKANVPPPPPVPSPPVEEDQPPQPEQRRTLSKAPPGDFPLPKGFVMPEKKSPEPAIEPPQAQKEIPAAEANPPPKVESPPPPPKPSPPEKAVAKKGGLPAFETFFPHSDENQVRQYKMLAIMVAIACCISLSFTLFQFFTRETSDTSAIIYLDINPSIALELNSKHKIVQVTPQNAQGAGVLAMGQLQDKTLDEGLEILLGLLNVYGYLSDNATILATVESSDKIEGEALSISVKESLDSLLTSINQNVTTVGLWADPKYEYSVSAEEHGISYGKRVLIEELSKQDFFFSLENLKPFSNAELYQLYASGSSNFPIGLASAMDLGKQALLLSDFDPFVVSVQSKLLENIPIYEAFYQTATHEYRVEIQGYTGQIENMYERQVGNTGFSLGLTQNQAKEAALSFAQKIELQVEHLSVKQDWSEGRLQYWVSFQEENAQVNLLLLGTTGEVLEHSIGDIDPNAVTDLGQNSIQDIAFADAGVKRSELSGTTFQRNQVDGVMVYELSFWSGNREYYYQISGTGLILQSSFMDYGEPEEEPSVTEITETIAKNTALEHAGASFSQVTGMVAGRDIDGDFIIEFSLDNTPYSYQISATTGDIISYEKKETAPEVASSTTDIGGEEAKLIALKEENLKEVMIQNIDLSFEGSGEEKAYHISFDFNGFSYYYVVQANSGEISHREKQVIQVLLPEPEIEDPTPEPSTEDVWEQFENFNDLFLEFDNNFNDFWS